MSILFNSSKVQLHIQKNSFFQPAQHVPKSRFKFTYQALILPNLPEPFYFLNFVSLIGQPKVPLFYNGSVIKKSALDTATVLLASGMHQVGHLKHYSISQECEFKDCSYKFGEIDWMWADFPDFKIKREDSELKLDLVVRTDSKATPYTPMKLGIFEHWSALCYCTGTLEYQRQQYAISGMGNLDYARAAYAPYLPLGLYTYLVINIDESTQVILMQLRDQWDHVLYSRCFIRSSQSTVQRFDEHVIFNIQRFFPQTITPNGKSMYLPREMTWSVYCKDQLVLELSAKSRGDFKFGIGAGYAGSLYYQLKLDQKYYEGSGAYCEYIDLRPLAWQEQDSLKKIPQEIMPLKPIAKKT